MQLDSTLEIYDCACLPLVGRAYVGTTYVLCVRIIREKEEKMILYSVLSYLCNLVCISITMMITLSYRCRDVRRIAWKEGSDQVLCRPYACMNGRPVKGPVPRTRTRFQRKLVSREGSINTRTTGRVEKPILNFWEIAYGFPGNSCDE